MDAAFENALTRSDAGRILELLGQGADLNSRDRRGQTALMRAAHAGNREIVEILIAHRADLDVTAKFGLSAMMLALVAGHADIALLLARAGADLSLMGTGAPGFAGKTAFDLAVKYGLPELSAALDPRPESTKSDPK